MEWVSGVNLKALLEKLPNSQLYGVDIAKTSWNLPAKFTMKRLLYNKSKMKKYHRTINFLMFRFTSSVLQHIHQLILRKYVTINQSY